MRNQNPPSGYYYPNRIARSYLLAMQDVIGANGLKALLNLVGLRTYIQGFPPDNMDREFEFAKFAAINQGVMDIYGLQGSQALLISAGRVTFDRGLRGFGLLAGISAGAFKALPLKTKVRVGLLALAQVFSQYSDQISYIEGSGDHYLYTIERCPECWERHSSKPLCFVAKGIIEEGLFWISDGFKFSVQELTCIATGGATCTFRIDPQPIH